MAQSIGMCMQNGRWLKATGLESVPGREPPKRQLVGENPELFEEAPEETRDRSLAMDDVCFRGALVQVVPKPGVGEASSRSTRRTVDELEAEALEVPLSPLWGCNAWAAGVVIRLVCVALLGSKRVVGQDAALLSSGSCFLAPGAAKQDKCAPTRS